MISFVVPAFNEEHELPASLESIRVAAETAGQSFEIIVVDDASTDATAEIARRAGARVLSVNYRHIAAVRNAGARAAQGEILFFVDADTQIVAAHVTGALAALKEGCAGGGARVEVHGPIPLWGRIFLRVFVLFTSPSISVPAHFSSLPAKTFWPVADSMNNILPARKFILLSL